MGGHGHGPEQSPLLSRGAPAEGLGCGVRSRIPVYVGCTALLAAVSGFLFGYDTVRPRYCPPRRTAPTCGGSNRH